MALYISRQWVAFDSRVWQFLRHEMKITQGSTSWTMKPIILPQQPYFFPITESNRHTLFHPTSLLVEEMKMATDTILSPLLKEEDSSMNKNDNAHVRLYIPHHIAQQPQYFDQRRYLFPLIVWVNAKPGLKEHLAPHVVREILQSCNFPIKTASKIYSYESWSSYYQDMVEQYPVPKFYKQANKNIIIPLPVQHNKTDQASEDFCVGSFAACHGLIWCGLFAPRNIFTPRTILDTCWFQLIPNMTKNVLNI